MKAKKKFERGRPFTYASVTRFFKRSWTLEEAQAYHAGSNAMLPANLELLKLIQLQKGTEV